MADIKSLLDERAQIRAEMLAVYDKAEKENRNLTVDEREAFDKASKKFADLTERYERAKEMDAQSAILKAPRDERADANVGNTKTEKRAGHQGEKYLAEYRRWMTSGEAGPEMRALQADSDTAGGYITAGEVSSQLIKALDNETMFRQRADIVTLTKAVSITFPELTASPAAPANAGEIATVTFDSTMAFGKREFTPRKLQKGIKVSRDLLRAAVLPIEQLIADEFAYQFAIADEDDYLNGSGTGEPLGVFTANAAGIPTGSTYNITTGNTTTAFTLTNLKTIVYDLPSQYRRNASWLFHREALLMLSLFKDGSGRFLLQDVVAAGEPMTFMGYRIIESEYSPHVFTTGKYVGLFGDLKKYKIVEVAGVEVQRSDEIYIETDQVGWFFRRHRDGGPYDARAFRRVTLG